MSLSLFLRIGKTLQLKRSYLNDLLCLQGKDPNYGNFLTVGRPSMSRMLSLPNDSYMLYPVKPVYGSVHERFSKHDSTLPGDKTKPVLTVHDTRIERECD